MKVTKFRNYLFIVCLAVFGLEVCDSQPSTRILFIGNSYTFVNGGLDKQLKGLAPSIVAECIAVGGYTLEKHWTEGNAVLKIREGKWDYVILQEQSQFPIINQKKFYDCARKFDEEIRRSGAKTILLMTWERPDSKEYGVTTDNLASAYTAIGKELDVKVAPAGLAFARAIRGNPELTLYSQDGHPTVEGTYLAACVLYQTIFENSPVGNPYSERSIPDEMRAYLQGIAVVNSGM
jgi:hypothetical protein